MPRESSLSLKLTFLLVVLGTYCLIRIVVITLKIHIVLTSFYADNVPGCTGLPLVTFSFSFAPGTTYRFAYKTDTSLNQISTFLSQSKPTRKDVGIKLNAIVEATSIWSNDDSHFVKLAVS